MQPPLDMSKVNGVSSECRKDSIKYIKSLESFDLWALKSEIEMSWKCSLINFKLSYSA